MSLKKRHIGRKVAGVGVGVALLVLGLEAPAFAAATVSAVSPASGPTDCVVDVTGTGFLDFPQAQQDLIFDAPAGGTDVTVDQANWFALSDTEIWAVVPVLVPGTTYTVDLDDPSGAGTSTATFLSTTAAGACAPTISTVTPTCGPAGTVVTITGTNLLGPDLTAGEVRFSPYTTDEIAAITAPDVSEPTSISVIVPTTAADGKIQLKTFGASGGKIFSTTVFQVPPPDCAPVTGNEHARSITFKLKKSGKASGVVSSTEDPAFTDCVASVPVKIQKKKKGDGWKTVKTTTTSDTGSYTAKVRNKKGKQKFRALAPKVSLGDPVTDVCLKAKSATRTI